MFQPHITPQSYYDEQAVATEKYIKWLTQPRVRTAPPPDLTPTSPFKQHSKAYIKEQLIKGL